MKAKLIRESKVAHGVIDDRVITLDDGRRVLPAGTIIEDDRAFRLVQMGMAEPADEECTLRASMNTADMKAAQAKQTMLSKGIHPDDYQRFLDGEIQGYDADGGDIPGPNWIPATDEDNEDDEE